jgi:hypothetical protein
MSWSGSDQTGRITHPCPRTADHHHPIDCYVAAYIQLGCRVGYAYTYIAIVEDRSTDQRKPIPLRYEIGGVVSHLRIML